MNDNEIIKALECCIKCECSSCQLFQWGSRTCERQLQSEALSIINRQKAEIEKLHEVIFKKEDLMQMMLTQKQEYYDELVSTKAEVERLQSEFDIMRFTTAKRWVKQAKSEARKEFVERLKGKGYIPNETWGITNKKAVRESDIDNLLAEMESERE